MADPTQLEVAVLNLAINARDAMPDGGVLTFATRRVTSSKATPSSTAATISQLSIADTGTGMTEDVAARAFEPFFTTKEVGKGTGLGLSMVYGMARQSGGSARIDSAPGDGTTVKPAVPGADRDAVARATADTPAAGDPDAATDASVLVDRRRSRRPRLHRRQPRGAGLSGARSERRPQRPESVPRRAAGPRRPRLHHARPVGRRSRQAHARRVGPASRSCSSPATAKPKRSAQAAPDAPLLTKPFRADALDKAVRAALAKG